MDVFTDRTPELDRLGRFWRSGRSHCIPVTGRRRVGKTSRLERVAAGKRHVYFQCALLTAEEQRA